MKSTTHKKKLSTVTLHASATMKKRIREALPHGAFKDIAEKLGVHYNTARRLDQPAVLAEAFKAIKHHREIQKKQMKNMRDMLKEVGIA